MTYKDDDADEYDDDTWESRIKDLIEKYEGFAEEFEDCAEIYGMIVDDLEEILADADDLY